MEECGPNKTSQAMPKLQRAIWIALKHSFRRVLVKGQICIQLHRRRSPAAMYQNFQE